MAQSPTAFFRFAADNVDLLLDVYRARASLTDGELHQLVRRHVRTLEPTPEHVVGRLLALGFIEAAPDASARYELTRPVEVLLRHLLREQRLSSAAVVQGYIRDLEVLADELAHAIAGGARGVALHALDEISSQIERVRQDSRANRDSITSEVVRLRANQDGLRPRERYEIVNRLWNRFLVPLRDLLDPDQAMEHCLDRLDRLLAEGRAVFAADGALELELARAQARLLRMRRDTADDLDECVREVEPLYQGLRRDTRIVQGASEALRIIRASGVTALRLDERFPIAAFRREGLMADGMLRAYLLAARGYTPPRPTPIAPGAAGVHQPPIDRARLRDAIAEEPAPGDLLGWLLRHFPDASPSDVLKAYGVFLTGVFGPVEPAGADERAYPVADVTLRAVPARLGAR